MPKVFRPPHEQLSGIDRARASLEESYRALRLPHWPADYFPPAVPYAGSVGSTEDEMVARLSADLPDLR